MAEEKDFITWSKLVEYPVYNAQMMKPCPEYESSILGIRSNTVLTPDCAYEDTTKNNETFVVKTYIRKYLDSGKDAYVKTLIRKDEFTKIMSECVKMEPKRYVWEHQDFHKKFNDSITQLCSILNDLNTDELFLRSGKEYILSSGIGTIMNGDLLSGAFSGLILKAYYARESGMMADITIPKMIHNSLSGNLTDSMLTYVDKEANFSIEFSGATLRKKANSQEYTCSMKIISNALNLKKVNSRSNTLRIEDGIYAPLMDKRLWVPTTKTDFRISRILPNMGNSAEVASEVPMDALHSRFKKIKGELV